MIYLVLCILCSSLLFVIFKGFARYKVNLLQAIVTNYIVAGLLGFVLAGYTGNVPGVYAITHAPWFGFAILIGLMFITVFNLMGISSQRAGVSATSVANKMSVVLPVVFGFTFLNEPVTGIKIAGIALAIVALWLTTSSVSRSGSGKAYLIYPVIIFFASGVLDIIISYCNDRFMQTGNTIVFTACLFTMAALFGVVYLAARVVMGKEKIRLRNIAGGIVLGIPNFGSILFVFLGLRETGMPVTEFFPVINIGIVMLAALLGWLIYSEKPTARTLAGIGIAAAAIVLISWRKW